MHITPDAFNGELSWDEWIGHFESVARVNEWDDATCLLWLEVRMTGKAQSVWRRITNEAKSNYDTAKAALRKRFEPDSRRELYAVELQTRRRNRGASWEELADTLRILADKAFPDLQDQAKNNFLWTDTLHHWISQNWHWQSNRNAPGILMKQ